jgi:hypothetical protein
MAAMSSLCLSAQLGAAQIGDYPMTAFNSNAIKPAHAGVRPSVSCDVRRFKSKGVGSAETSFRSE